ncbi:MAG: RNA-binding transcriptional accessory protein [Synechococcales cyanobacterium CRU_2_2]|nr:RNA-binding transcriptional accessory protein [Synechococcales cyanobacterium CRU_2_2]
MPTASFSHQIAQELNLRSNQVQSALDLFDEGATIPFVARYRKERTGELNEIELRQIQERQGYLSELYERKQTILRAIAEQNKLTPELQAKIEACDQKTELEDLYLPYKPKRRTKATLAREKGLQPLADWVEWLNNTQAVEGDLEGDLESEASKYIDLEKGVATVEDALQGAADILAESVAEQVDLRVWVREFVLREGVFAAKIKAEFPEGSTKFETYRNYQRSFQSVAPHNLLALMRGQAEGVLSFGLNFDEDAVLFELDSRILRSKNAAVRKFYQALIRDAFKRLMKTSLVNSVIAEQKEWADIESIKTFETNLRDLLLSAPAGMKPTLALDPGFRTGCKVAVIDQTGQYLDYQAIFPHTGAGNREQAARILKRLIEQYKVELIAIGNGTASRETETFVAEVFQQLDLSKLKQMPTKVMVNESGASIYSASEVAIAEFPDLDITVRGAISIGRRLQDPLAELVKIDPKSIGVGQYQHDVDQKLLKQKLAETVESCVNYVGVDLNTASKELLMYVSGISGTIANNIVAYRNEHGAFGDRKQLLKVPKLGPKAFEQCAGFLRIRNGKNPLDNTAVHPESYRIVSTILQDCQIVLTSKDELKGLEIDRIDLQRYVTETVGEPTLRDILTELEKPGRDPRAQFTYAQFRDDINAISDLKEGMELEGIVTNVANFGAFVDIGVHQDGLVHVSQLANQFVSDPKQVVKVGQVVKVRVMEVNEKLKRIGLSIKAVAGNATTAAAASTARPTQAEQPLGRDRPQSGRPKPSQAGKPQINPAVDRPQGQASLEDLKRRFGKKL